MATLHVTSNRTPNAHEYHIVGVSYGTLFIEPFLLDCRIYAKSCLRKALTDFQQLADSHSGLDRKIHDNTKPFARVGRKAYGSHRGSRVAEIS